MNAAPGDYPGGQEGKELTVEFTVLGRRFVGLNGGPNFRPNEAVSFMVVTESQERPTDTGTRSSATVVTRALAAGAGIAGVSPGRSRHDGCLSLTTSSDRDAAKRAFEAMMTMAKIDIAALDAAVDGN